MSSINARQIADRAGIADLNPMQQCMAESDARQIVLLSPTGTGKTLAFAIRMVRALDLEPTGATQAVIIAPSRELVTQIYGVIRPLVAPLRTVALYGGHSVTDERNSLSSAPDVVVATPGRLLDHLNRGRLDISHATALVLDEYDKSLELGFYDEMKRICRHITRPSLVMLTSATRLDELPDFLHLTQPRIYSFGAAESPRSKMRVALVGSPVADKLETLDTLLRSLDSGRYIIFVNHREAADRVHRYLARRGIPAGLYHGGLDQQLRARAVDLLANGTTPVMVSTDLGARGLDIDGISGIIHYHMPATSQAWTHRNGRTARMGASGNVYLIKSPDEDIPEYVTVDFDYHPSGHSADPIHPLAQTLYLDRGKREKISRRDIVGWLTQQGGLAGDAIGLISLGDHNALIAVSPDTDTAALCARLRAVPLKGHRARLSPVRP